MKHCVHLKLSKPIKTNLIAKQCKFLSNSLLFFWLHVYYYALRMYG